MSLEEPDHVCLVSWRIKLYTVGFGVWYSGVRQGPAGNRLLLRGNCPVMLKDDHSVKGERRWHLGTDRGRGGAGGTFRQGPIKGQRG